MMLKLGFDYKGEFYGINYKGKKKLKKVQATTGTDTEQPKVKVIIQNHPVYEKYATMFREKVLALTKCPDYAEIKHKFDGVDEIFSYAGIDYLRVNPVEYLDMTDVKDKKKHYLTMKITVIEMQKTEMAN